MNGQRETPKSKRSTFAVLACLCVLTSASAEVGPADDPANPSIWPNQTSRANSDRWLVGHHDEIQRLNPRLLVMNFDNHAPREKLERLVSQIIAGIAEGSRYHGYKDPNSAVFLQYQVFKFVDLRDTNAPKSELNSRLFPLKPGVTNTFNVDHNRLFSAEFGPHYGVRDPREPQRFLSLEELVDLGYVHEVWIISNGDEPRIKAFECVELKPRYNERFERVGNEYVQPATAAIPTRNGLA